MDDINFIHTHVNGYEFRAGFELDILQGRKLQTFRKLRQGEHMPIPGERIVGWIPGKQPDAVRLVLDTPIIDVQTIYMDFGVTDPIFVAGHALTRSEREAFSKAEGFPTYQKMCEFIFDQYGHLPFRGVLIKWEVK